MAALTQFVQGNSTTDFKREDRGKVVNVVLKYYQKLPWSEAGLRKNAKQCFVKLFSLLMLNKTKHLQR